MMYRAISRRYLFKILIFTACTEQLCTENVNILSKPVPVNTATTLLIKMEQNQEKITPIYLSSFLLCLKPQFTLIILAETH